MLTRLTMQALPLFLDRLANPVTAIIMSVTAVLFFGEIIPQSICTRCAQLLCSSVRASHASLPSMLVSTLVHATPPASQPCMQHCMHMCRPCSADAWCLVCMRCVVQVWAGNWRAPVVAGAGPYDPVQPRELAHWAPS